ncbi:MAG: hypothetical protein JWM57_51 [Phycisphaerales bacterium]|nr:hypothetical protein [Phycisphaerales bacterium]
MSVFRWMSVILAVLSVVAWAIRPPADDGGRTRLDWTSDDNPVRREHIARFEASHSDLRLRLNPSSGDPQPVIVQSLGGVGPDLFECYTPAQLAGYVQAGVAWDVTDALDAARIDMIRDTWPAMSAYTRYAGRTYGFPANAAVDVMFLDTAAFADAGIPLPSGPMTWDVFLPIAQKLMKRDAAGRTTRFAIAFDDPFWHTLLMQWGGSLFSTGGGRCTLDAPEAITATQFLHDLIYKYEVCPSPAQIDAMSAEGGWGSKGMKMLSSGRAAAAIGGRWWLCTLRANEQLKLSACEMPHGPAGRIFLGYGRSTLINRASPHREQAFEYLKYMASPAYTNLVNQQADAMGPVAKYCTDESLVNPKFPAEAAYQRVFRDVMPLGRAEASSPFVSGTVVERVVKTQLDMVTRDAKTAEQAMRDAATEINAAIAANVARDPDLAKQYDSLTPSERP